MPNFAKIVLSAYGLAFAIAIILLVILIVRRIRIKKRESFENRDN